MGFAGKTDGASDTGVILCHALKLACRAIIGYPSSQEFTLAAIRGEVDATVLTEDSALRFSRDGQLRPIVVTGGQPSELMPDVPTIYAATKLNDEGEWWIDFRDDLRKLGRLIVAPPGVPAARLRLLSDSLKAIENDPAIKAEFEAKELPLRYAPGPEMETIIGRILGGGVSPQRLDEIRHVINEEFY